MFRRTAILSSVVARMYRIIESLPVLLANSKVELSPLFIACGLNDIITISAPMVDKNALYYLTKPNGDVTKIDIQQPSYIKRKHNDLYNDEIAVKHVKADARPIVTPLNNYQILNVKDKRLNELEMEERIESSDIVIGPLTEDDHGNWVLSVYHKDLDGNWIELFQVITIEIVENVPPSLSNPKISLGDEFRPSFAYPIKNLESCELIAPGSTFDRFYTRSNIEFDRCGYVIDNVTKPDEGLWTIIGVGRIVYETQIYLKILNTIT
ncbi:uncharacterized protein LOC115455076 isoform X2 [Manduca sexta]|uniref:uncharacterized protein LOC115455076 isoform X2 n=1 Tax=Manduca sexta TaxID=7130 RepID=UPI00188DE14B|nr:uncharacterized protein LOC115455076 isoform X2 [Manduca sexta]